MHDALAAVNISRYKISANFPQICRI